VARRTDTQRRSRPFGYDPRVRSVADQLKAEDLARMAALSPEERIGLSLRLGESAIEVLCAAQGLTRAEALALVQRIRSEGRRASPCASR
jgi:hypothetical protein